MSDKKVEQFHNSVASIVKHYLKDVSLADIILTLEILKADLVRQKASLMYSKKPTKIGDKSGI